MLRICPSHQGVSTLAYDNNAAAGTSIIGTGNAHHYHINNSVFKVLNGRPLLLENIERKKKKEKKRKKKKSLRQLRNILYG